MKKNKKPDFGIYPGDFVKYQGNNKTIITYKNKKLGEVQSGDICMVTEVHSFGGNMDDLNLKVSVKGFTFSEEKRFFDVIDSGYRIKHRLMRNVVLTMFGLQIASFLYLFFR